MLCPSKTEDAMFYCTPQERWKMTAEQAKAESTQRGLEEERRALSMQINMEREELERAKVRLTHLHIGAGSGRALCPSLPYLSCLSLSPSERIAGGAEVGDAALCGGEEEAGG